VQVRGAKVKAGVGGAGGGKGGKAVVKPVLDVETDAKKASMRIAQCCHRRKMKNECSSSGLNWSFGGHSHEKDFEIITLNDRLGLN
jgi:hypothetical protein